jgi:hypothetical protein
VLVMAAVVVVVVVVVCGQLSPVLLSLLTVLLSLLCHHLSSLLYLQPAALLDTSSLDVGSSCTAEPCL